MQKNVPEFSVSEFSRAIKFLIEDSFGYVRIKGEITGFKRSSSGHIYFNLKEENSTLSAVCFRAAAMNIGFEIGDGLQVSAQGKITTFEGRSNYQIIVDKIEVSGIGAILEMIEKRRQKLLAEGLFDEKHKKEIPYFPRIIGIITSETGAVIEDIKHRIFARCPTHLIIYPSLMQGTKATLEIIKGLKYFNKLKNNRPDVLIIARGGGSFEDLLSFNDEELVREVFKSEIPVVSAIGHETDTTLVDLVADLRAPTPTASAEIVTPVLADLNYAFNSFSERLDFFTKKLIENHLSHLANLDKYLINPEQILARNKDFLFLLTDKLEYLKEVFFEKKTEYLKNLNVNQETLSYKIDKLEIKIVHDLQLIEDRIQNELRSHDYNLSSLVKSLKSNHYQEVLKRGFALIKDKKGNLISSAKIANQQEENITIEMSDGEFKANIYDEKAPTFFNKNN